jgi:putative ABC transport system permease protein
MNYKILLKIALQNILKNRLRTFLTMLGIIIGVAAVIAMVSIGQGAQKRIEDQISSMGTNLLMIFPGSGRFGGIHQTINKLSLEDIHKISEQCASVDRVSAVIRSMSQVIAGIKNCNTSISGVSQDFFIIRQWPVQTGALFTSKDVKANAKVAVLGTSVADKLFKNQSAIGKQVRIGAVPFKVIGVLAEKGTSAGPEGDQDDAVFIPQTTMLNRITGGRTIDNIMVSARSTEEMSNAQAQISAVLRRSHNIHKNSADDFSIMNQTEIIEMAAETTQTFTLLLGAIAGVSLIVGGIGIMNIMLVSVTERTREIGIRLAVGAHGSDILVQFIVEAAVISMIGGCIGICAGIGTSFFLNLVFKLSIIISPVMSLVSFLFSGAIGIFFGFYPARRASDMNPIEALRYE